MRRIFFFVSFFFITIQLIPAIEFKTVYNTDKVFQCRMRLNYSAYQFSLNTLVEQSELNYIEPTVISPCLSIGRLYLKGLIREFVNPDGLTPSAGFFNEATKMRASDSLSPGSRYGLFFSVTDLIPLSAWAYKTNSYGFSSGAGLEPIKIIETRKFLATSSFFVNISNTETKEFNSWFENEVILPDQSVLNIFSEVRCLLGEIKSIDRNYNLNKNKSLSFFTSCLGGLSLPKYSESGFLLRGEASGGNRNIFIRGIFQYISPSYINSAGSLTENSLIFGGTLKLNLSLQRFDLKVQSSYCRWIEQMGILPALSQPQKDQIDLKINLSSKLFKIQVEQKYKTFIDDYRIKSTEYDVDIDADLDFKIIKFIAGAGITYERYSDKDQFLYDWILGAALHYKLVKCELSFNLKEDESNIAKITTSINIKNFTIFAKLYSEDFKNVFFESGIEFKHNFLK